MTKRSALLIIPAGNDNRKSRGKLPGSIDNPKGKPNGQMHKVIGAQFKQFRPSGNSGLYLLLGFLQCLGCYRNR
jgi:hypothetical protein